MSTNREEVVYSQVNRQQLPPPPPPNYLPSPTEYNYLNFGLPIYDGTTQQYRLRNSVTWKPFLSPTTLILSMNNMFLIKVGLPPSEVNTLNSTMYEMRRALPLTTYENSDVEYVTHNTIIFMSVDDSTSVQVLRGGYIMMRPAAVLTRWPNSEVRTLDIRLSILGLKRCCGKFSAILHVDSIMVEEEEDEGIHENNALSSFHVL